MGLGPLAQEAIRGLKRTWTKGGAGELRVAIAGQGAVPDMQRLPGRLGASVNAILGPSSAWVSATPFVPPRHLKTRGKSSLEAQILAELEVRGLPAASVRVLPWTPETLALRHVVRRRRPPAPQPPVDAGFVVELRFAQPIAGPVNLGYASHFGLGQFRSDEARS